MTYKSDKETKNEGRSKKDDKEVEKKDEKEVDKVIESQRIPS